MSVLLLFQTPGAPTNIEILPLLYAVVGAGEGDLFLSFAIYEADGVTPLSLAGISFSGSIHSSTAVIASLSGSQIVVSNTSTITIRVPGAQVATWMAGQYQLDVTATDGTNTRDLFSGALVVVGEMVNPMISVIFTPGPKVLL